MVIYYLYKLEVEKQYYITFIYDCLMNCYTYILKSKYNGFKMFKNYNNEVKNQLIKVIKTYRGGE